MAGKTPPERRIYIYFDQIKDDIKSGRIEKCESNSRFDKE